MAIKVDGKTVSFKISGGGGGTIYTAGEGIVFTQTAGGIAINVKAPVIPLTRAEYDALPQEEKRKDALYLITDEDPAPGLPAGGGTGQILAKKSAEDYDARWVDPSEGGGAASGVASFKGRTGAVTPQEGDYTAGMVGALPASTSIPAKTSDLTNDSGFVTAETVNSAIQTAILDSWEGSY